MKVLFDHQILVNQKIGGISRYFYNLTNALSDLPECEYDFSCLINKNYFFLDNPDLFSIPKVKSKFLDNLIYRRKPTAILNWMSEFSTIKLIHKNQHDVVHVTDHNVGYLKNCKTNKPVVLTVHDLIPELFPNSFPFIKERLEMRAFSFKRADFFICISESTKKDLIDIYGISKEKTRVIHHGDPSYFNNISSNYRYINDFNGRARYLLYVGDRNATHKNFVKTVEETSQILLKNEDVFFLCVGNDFSYTELKKFQMMGISKKMFSIKASDEQLFQIYKNAICLVYPSLYEGFGLPILEAMKASCPILCSDSSCLPEIAKNGALYFDPVNFTNFKSNLQSFIDNKNVSQLIEKQKIILNDFSWSKTGKMTLEVYNEVNL
jgi:glycosyltransferase involved in cell wall biosynthesis